MGTNRLLQVQDHKQKPGAESPTERARPSTCGAPALAPFAPCGGEKITPPSLQVAPSSVERRAWTEKCLRASVRLCRNLTPRWELILLLAEISKRREFSVKSGFRSAP
eukprot:COSAG01_NODE_10_length_42970_cov_93.010007_11_plen_108_part_00